MLHPHKKSQIILISISIIALTIIGTYIRENSTSETIDLIGIMIRSTELAGFSYIMFRKTSQLLYFVSIVPIAILAVIAWKATISIIVIAIFIWTIIGFKKINQNPT